MVSRFCFKTAIVCMFLALGASDTRSQMPPAEEGLSSDMGKVEFENESMIVVRIHMAPHEKTPMHDIVSPRLVIWLTDAHLKDTGLDGKAIEYSRTSGSIDWITPRQHMGENLSDRSIDFLAVIPKVVTGTGSQQTSPR